MAIPQLHHISAVRLGKSVSPVTLGGISGQSAILNSEVVNDVTSGELSPRWTSLKGQKPVIEFVTKALATALTNFGITGVDIATAYAGTDKLSFYGTKATDGGTRTAGSTHQQWRIAKGLLVLGRLSCQHGEDAELTVRVIPTYDGTNNPIVTLSNVALPASIIDTERFAMGPITLLGVLMGGFRSIDIDFGVQAMSEGADGTIWDSFAYVREIAPVITLRGVDLLQFGGNIPIGGTPITHANSKLFFRKRAAGGTLVADGTAEHVKMTMEGMLFVEQPFGGQGNVPMEADLRIICKYDGTNQPLVITQNVAVA